MQFELTKDQTEIAEEFIAEHECSIPLDEWGYPLVGAIGGHITYSFTATGLGYVQKVYCTCGAECDLTEYHLW